MQEREDSRCGEHATARNNVNAEVSSSQEGFPFLTCWVLFMHEISDPMFSHGHDQVKPG